MFGSMVLVLFKLSFRKERQLVFRNEEMVKKDGIIKMR